MKMLASRPVIRVFRRAFTLVELMIATAIGVGLSGTVVLLLVQSATEQRNGFADISVEEQAYILEANITRCLRSMSANQGLTPNYSTGLHDPFGNLLGYQSVVAFFPTNGAYLTATITYIASTGQVIYTPDVTSPSVQTQWITNNASAALTELYFSTSFNPDGSQNSSLVNVGFQMNDNGFSQRNPTNNPAGIFRTFSVQMRNDN
jgi:prepilin-type N-terminal cleavage/methylation domain-containing protein